MPSSSTANLAVWSTRLFVGAFVALSIVSTTVVAAIVDPNEGTDSVDALARESFEKEAGAVLGSAPMRDVHPALAVRVRRVDGSPLTGTITRWSTDGLVGSFGVVRWASLQAMDVWRLFRRLMDRTDANDWIALGEAMLLTEGGGGLGQSAFETARSLDTSIDPETGVDARIRDARIRAAQAIRERDAPADSGVAAHRLRLEPPEWKSWLPIPWPTPSADELEVDDERLREDVAGVLAMLGLDLERVRTDSLHLYATGSRVELARIALRLESTRQRLAERLGVDPEELVKLGRIPIIVVDHRDDFRAIQQRVFLQLDRPEVTAMAHSLGSRAFVVAYRGADGPELEHALVRQLVHAYMHRVVSPVRLPPWANEGLAESVAAEVVPEVQTARIERRRALTTLRGGFDPTRILAAEYGDPAWPGDQQLGPIFGRLLVELLAADQPTAFHSWVVDVKNGEPWADALGNRFGMPPGRIIQIFVRHHRTRD